MDACERKRFEKYYGVCLEESGYFSTVDRFYDILKEALDDPKKEKLAYLLEYLDHKKIDPSIFVSLAFRLSEYKYSHIDKDVR